MNTKVMRLKARIKALAQEEGLPAQVVLQNFMFERFFARLSKSVVRENLILKGGTLISQYLGLSRRATMDIDVTLHHAPLSEQSIYTRIQEVFSVNLGDDISWELNSLSPIRDNDQYGGFRAKITASFGSLIVPFAIDISTGDAITPAAEDYFFKSIFVKNESYRLKAYTIETVISEKIDAILSFGTLSTRPRDYYDAYMLTQVVNYSSKRLKSALRATAHHRGSTAIHQEWAHILQEVKQSDIMQSRWDKYQHQYAFARNISFRQICEHLFDLLTELNESGKAM